MSARRFSAWYAVTYQTQKSTQSPARELTPLYCNTQFSCNTQERLLSVGRLAMAASFITFSFIRRYKLWAWHNNPRANTSANEYKEP